MGKVLVSLSVFSLFILGFILFVVLNNPDPLDTEPTITVINSVNESESTPNTKELVNESSLYKEYNTFAVEGDAPLIDIAVLVFYGNTSTLPADNEYPIIQFDINQIDGSFDELYDYMADREIHTLVHICGDNIDLMTQIKRDTNLSIVSTFCRGER